MKFDFKPFCTFIMLGGIPRLKVMILTIDALAPPKEPSEV